MRNADSAEGEKRALVPIVLLTDFGLEGPYVGQMKGVLAMLAPGHPVIDLTHAVSPQDIREGAFLLEVSWRYFPAGSIFVAVVDPGVGTERAALALLAEGRHFAGPDNGLLPGALPLDSIREAVRIDSTRIEPHAASATFHGRDVFAPAGAALAAGTALGSLGAPTRRWRNLPRRSPRIESERLSGCIVHIDRFGNCVSDISRADWDAWIAGRTENAPEFRVEGCLLSGLHRTYGDASTGEAIALFGSMGYLEAAVVNGSAAVRFGLRWGGSFVVSLT